MKRPSISDSSRVMIPICSSAEAKGSGSNNNVYSRGFRSMLDGMDDEDCIEESGLIGEKKRRLSIEQVKTLEKSFEVENKLEPERKVTLARELGLQPRQVAVWFQNRRARWKTKQLERDYGLLKSDYEALKLNFDTLHRDNEALSVEIEQLKSKLGVKNVESGCRVKEEITQSDSKTRVFEQNKMEDDIDQNREHCDGRLMMFGDFKDGSSDSDSSAILNEDHAPHSVISCEILHPKEPPVPSIRRFDCASSSHSSINYLQFSDYPRIASNTQKACHQMMRMEENNLQTGGDEHCNFFEDEQAPSLLWYCPEPWI